MSSKKFSPSKCSISCWNILADIPVNFFTQGLPRVCQVCQIPVFFTEPDDPTQLVYEEGTYLGQKFQAKPKPGTQAWFEQEVSDMEQAGLLFAVIGL